MTVVTRTEVPRTSGTVELGQARVEAVHLVDSDEGDGIGLEDLLDGLLARRAPFAEGPVAARRTVGLVPRDALGELSCSLVV